MDLGLTENLMRQHAVKAPQNGSGGFIARGLDGEKDGHLFFVTTQVGASKRWHLFCCTGQ